MDAGAAFLARSRAYLSDEFLPKVRAAVERLPEEKLWWRPNEASNSVGNLLLHMSGNLRQWLVHGVAGEPDVRRRQAEFDAREGAGRDELLGLVADTVAQAVAALRGLEPARLGERITVQGRDVTLLDAIYHGVEHFGGHTYQVLYITKLVTAEDLGFYRDKGGGIVVDAWNA